MIGRKLLQVSIAAALCAAAGQAQTHPGVSFDETLRSTRAASASGNTKPALLHIATSGGNLRIDVEGSLPGSRGIPGGNAAIMLFTDSGTKLTFVNTEKKQYLTINTLEIFEGMTKMMDAMGGKISIDTSATKLNLDSLGPGPAVDGHPTLRYRLTTSLRMTLSMMGNSNAFEQESVEDIQAATDLVDLVDANAALTRFSSAGQSMGMAPDFVKRVLDVKKKIRGFPVRVTKVQTIRTNGQTRNSSEDLEISNIKRLAVPDSLFRVPAGYTQVVPQRFPNTVNQ